MVKPVQPLTIMAVHMARENKLYIGTYGWE
jgi:hypothetical protein